MKLGVVALDYDGTIADHGVLHPAVRAAILSARERGITVVLVTGRIVDELRRVAGDLRFVDAVVAENGAVLAFPATGYSQVLAAPPPPAFLDQLRTRGVRAKQGHVVVEADAEQSAVILNVIQDQQLPLTLLFNRDRVMVLPQAVNKATGLRELLRTLRCSEHNAIAVGDAENDHALLETCEIGAAVAWGSPALKAVADEIVDGDGPRAVAAYLDRLAANPLLDPVRTRRHRVVLGTDQDGDFLTLASGAGNVIIGGDPRSGKSWLGGLLAEQLVLQRYCLCVVDPEGDHGSLASLPGVAILGGEDPPPGPSDVMRALRHPDASVVVDLSRVPHPEKRAHVASLLATLAALRRQTGLPHRIVIDEAHDFLHAPPDRDLLALGLGGYALVTDRMSEVHPEILAACETLITTRVTDSRELQAAIGRYGTASASADWAEQLANLSLGDAVLLPSRATEAAMLRRFRLSPRLSPQVRRGRTVTPRSPSATSPSTLRSDTVGAGEHSGRFANAAVARMSRQERWSTARHSGVAKEGEMSGPFIELTESETSRPMLVNVDRVICIAPHGRGGSFIFLAGGPDRIEVEEGPGRVSEILQAAGVLYAREELQE